MRTVLLVAAIAVTSAGAGAGAARAQGKHSMKGWELYTWFDLACSASPQLHSAPNDDSWCAALVVGTNREKTPAEIRKTPIKWRDLAAALGGLRKGEDVAWIARPDGFARPDARLAAPIAAVATQHGVTLTDVDRK